MRFARPITIVATLAMASKTLRYCLVWSLFAIGCHDNGPTAPKATPTPTPTPISLYGTWTGTATERGLSDEWFCPPRSRSVSVEIAQAGNAVSFSIPHGIGCSQGGAETFEGTVTGAQVSGTVRVDGLCVLSGPFSATAQVSQMHIAGTLRGSCNRVGIDIDLIR